jgi:hypothetical protein
MKVPVATATGATAAGAGFADDDEADGADADGGAAAGAEAVGADGDALANGAISAWVSCSFAGGGGNTKGNRKNPNATPNPIPRIPPNRKIAIPRQKARMTAPP